ncbi:hypothetical protein M409DRAFT_19817 [Zasmidium cellare ATCC 36951]|uniref:ribose-phosphate diphosphokinase n=1 Tax=Zasmidium cellare ATCC 36951 TaxID=1080233 RepID=A0A6A6CT22_ZASCE|nr:uncharacterized protein M409DRAFT_19817 [Zasmidium cellare ATCC 36951]KAF2170215.1 hypothetical protein M409DRAFT_19817 [Zasmidium cellare ATCC 36951]
MVRNILLFSGSSHPNLTEGICTHLGIPPAKIHLSKFSVGETRVEVGESVRGKDVFIVQSACSTKQNGNGAGMSLNDGLMELLITISACKTASARRVTAVLPLFPYSRQSDLPYNKVGAPLARMPAKTGEDGKYTFDSRPSTPGPSSHPRDEKLEKKLNGMHLNGELKMPRRKDTLDSVQSDVSVSSASGSQNGAPSRPTPTSAPSSTTPTAVIPPEFKPQRGYKQWVAQAGTLVADLLTCAGADHIITMDLHDPQYQGFFDIPVDNLYGRHLLKRYITHEILPKEGGADNCVIVSPDAGGAKRATSIADSLGIEFALIHKERRNPAHQSNVAHPSSALLLVGQVKGKICILVDDLADTSNTITRAAKLLKKEGAEKVYALVTHGVLSGDGVDRIFHSVLDKVVVTNSVPQDDHVHRMDELAAQHGRPAGKLEVLEVAGVFAEAIRRVHHGESISVLFQYD